MEKAEKLTSKAFTPEAEVLDWEKRIFARYRNQCANCGSPDLLRVRLVVPVEAGGQYIDANGVVLCRACEMAADAVRLGAKSSDQRLVNFWVSRSLFDRIQSSIKATAAFNSMGSMVRYLIAKYVEDPARFEDLDLELYQDAGADSKINIWVERDRYDVFKTLLSKSGRTVTDTIKSLIAVYLLIEAERITAVEESNSPGGAA